MIPDDNFSCSFDWLKTVIETLFYDDNCTKTYTLNGFECTSRHHEHVGEANILS